MDSKQANKRKRGRPRKNSEKLDQPEKNDHKEKIEENILLFMALSDEEDTDNNDSDSNEDNRFTINDTETKNEIVDSISDSEDSDNNINIHNEQLTVKMLIEEVKKRDHIIANLKSKGGNVLSSYNTTKSAHINYHCTVVADAETGKSFVPKPTDYRCWWCDESFTELPAYIVNYYRNNTYYVFGNFCSFNCALKYNLKMLKDYKINTRHALTNNLRTKVTGSSAPIKFAGDRELLKSKGGNMSIEKFREGFSFMSINIPPLIPLVHVIEDGK